MNHGKSEIYRQTIIKLDPSTACVSLKIGRYCLLTPISSEKPTAPTFCGNRSAAKPGRPSLNRYSACGISLRFHKRLWKRIVLRRLCSPAYKSMKCFVKCIFKLLTQNFSAQRETWQNERE